MDRTTPAILGAEPAFEERIDIVRPALPNLGSISAQIEEILGSGKLTNNSKYVRKFEDEFSWKFNIRYCVAVSNATLGLVLAIRAMGLKGEVILPSFTFCATAQALLWNNIKPVFADIDKRTYTIDPGSVEKRITKRTAAVLGVTIFGNPCNINRLERLVRRKSLKLILDSAQGVGSRYKEKFLGSFGDCEVFSFHATKILPVGEGGMVCTRDKLIYQKVRQARDFAKGSGDNCNDIGINAKMMEFSAILGLKNLGNIEGAVKKRERISNLVIKRFRGVKGIRFQELTGDAGTNFQNLSILIDEGLFGLSRDQLYESMLRENITVKKYFYPALHKMDYFKKYSTARLPNTDYISERILCLPLYSNMRTKEAEKICLALLRIYNNAGSIKAYFKRGHELGKFFKNFPNS